MRSRSVFWSHIPRQLIVGDWRRSTAIRRFVLLSLVVGLVGCGGLDPVAPFEQITDPAQLFMKLTVDHPAVNLSTTAPYDTLQLTAVPRNALGEQMTGLPAPVFRLNHAFDSVKVQVTPAGLLTAKAQALTPVLVLAEIVTSDNVRRVDSIYVAVTTDPAPPVLASFSIPLDSAIWPLQPAFIHGAIILYYAGIQPFLFDPQLLPQALDAADAPIDGLVVEYTSLDPSTATVNRWTGEVATHQQGQVRMVARTTAYGVSKVDTAAYAVTWPIIQGVFIEQAPNKLPRFGVANPLFGGVATQNESVITIAPGGFIVWFNDFSDSADVTFDDPTNVADGPSELCDGGGVSPISFFTPDPGPYCGAGNIPVIPPGMPPGDPFTAFVRVRKFPVPGAYPYHSTRLGITGKVIVK